jgi:hypothetical protein
MTQITDYWLNKLFYDVQKPEIAARFKSNMQVFLADYPMKPVLRDAILADDLATIAPHANAYLLRFYYTVRGVNDAIASSVGSASPSGG